MGSDKTVLKNIKDSLAREAEIGPFVHSVSLRVRNGEVIANGSIPFGALKNKIVQIIIKTPGVKSLTDYLKVEPSQQRVGVVFDWTKGRMALS